MKKNVNKDKILDVSERLFAKKGFNSTSLDEIALKAKTSKGLIVYHFKNKINLWNQVEKRIFEQVLKIQICSAETCSNPEDAINTAVLSRQNLNKNPRIPRILMWKYLEKIGNSSWPITDEPANKAPIIFKKFIAEGKLPNDIDPLSYFAIYLYRTITNNILGYNNKLLLFKKAYQPIKF